MRFTGNNMKLEQESTNIELSTVSIGLTKESALYVRIYRLIQDELVLTKRARLQGFYDFMLGEKCRAKEFSSKLEVSYLSGWKQGQSKRESLKGDPWVETTINKVETKWEWTVYVEGYYAGSGKTSSQVKAETDSFEFKYNLKYGK